MRQYVQGAPPRSDGQLQSIQVLRAVAALSVLFFHFGDSLLAAHGLAPANPFEVGAHGVDIFFVISGFIICYTTRDDVSPRRFLVKRAARIVPLYYLLTGLLFLVALAASNLLSTTTADPIALLKSLLFIPYARPGGVPQPILFLGWTLNYEIFFYLLFSLSLCFPARRWAILIALFAGLELAGLLVRTDSVIVHFYTRGVILEFLYGCAVYAVWRHAPEVLRRVGPFWPLAAAALIAQNFFTLPLREEIAFGLPAAALVACALGAPSAGPLTQPFAAGLAALGDASYSLYLIHPYVVQAFARLALPKLGGGLPAAVLCAVLASALAIGLSLIVYRRFEKPANVYLRRLAGRTPKMAPGPA